MKKVKRKLIKSRKAKRSVDRLLPLPTDEKIAAVARIIEKTVHRETLRRKYAPVKTVLTLLGVGTLVGLSLVSPAALVLAKPFVDAKRERERDEWKRYNPYFLRRTIHRLRRQKLVTISEKDGESVVELTQNGKRRILRYALDDLQIEKQKIWDGKWRLVIYDVAEKKRVLRDVFRRTLQSLGFLQLQESVWLCPYPCEREISFLREYFGVGNEVLYIIAQHLEDDMPYKAYFGI